MFKAYSDGKNLVKKRMLIVCLGLVPTALIPLTAMPSDDLLDYLPAILAGIKEAPPPLPPLPEGVFVQSTTTQSDFFGDVLIVGEVFNNTPNKLEFVRISANIFNGNSLVDTDFTFTSLDIVQPNSRACFKMFTDYGGSYTRIGFEPVSFRITNDPIPNIRAVNVSRSADFFGDFRLLGLLRNDSSSTVEFANVIATMYGADNRVVDCDFTFPNNSTLSPGQSSGFEMFTGTPNEQVTRFFLQTDGNF